VVACEGGVSHDLIIDGYNGFLIHPGKTEELASVISKIISHPNLVVEVEKNARESVEKLYHWDKVTDDFEKVLRATVIGDKKEFTLKRVPTEEKEGQ